MKLLILNYSMNPNNMVFGNQFKVVAGLARCFDYCHVVTADSYTDYKDNKVKVVSSNWIIERRILSAIRFLIVAVPLIIKNRRQLIVFSHMTEVQSALLAPLTFVLGVKHFLWYAHKSNSFFLQICHRMLTGIVTSSEGSCPLSGKKVFYIGQCVDHSTFSTPNFSASNPPLKWYHIGRIDPAKRIEEIIEAFRELRTQGWPLTLSIFGAPSSTKYSGYFDYIQRLSTGFEYCNWLSLHEPVPNHQINNQSLTFDGFAHAFRGSLDKTLIEATFLKKVVASVNEEYHRIFFLKEERHLSSKSLKELILETLLTSPEEQNRRIAQRYKVALSDHSLDVWIKKLESLLKK